VICADRASLSRAEKSEPLRLNTASFGELFGVTSPDKVVDAEELPAKQSSPSTNVGFSAFSVIPTPPS
jgi:hypothetical protein